jgi:hypothetical protein
VVIAVAVLLPAMAVAADPVTFSATGAAQTFTVPSGVISISATVGGAAGGAFGPGAPGDYAGRNGGQTKATLLVAPGSVLTLVVGKQGGLRGASASGGYGGGGAAGGSGGTGGGGGSFVFGPAGVLLLAAGGGGGWGDINWGGEGAGAGTVSQRGLPDGGGPGTETAGGGPGSSGGTAGGGPATIASFATTGGAGGGATGGGGGGGYFGGGGGGGSDGLWGGHGGGGGSGYASADMALVSGASGSVGTQAGDGQIIFVLNEGPVPPAAVECANGSDDDHDGFTDADDPQCKLNRGAEGPVDNPLIACTDNDIVLINVARVGRHVLVSGVADRSLRGRKMEIFAGDTKAGDALVASDGSFATRVRAPSAPKARTIRYQARLDRRRSRALKLARHMSVTTARATGAAVVIAGRVSASRHKRPVVELLGRTGGCNNRTFVVVGRARLRPDGRFRVTAKPFPGLAIAIYRARTAIPSGRTYTLPQAVKLR